MTDPQMITVVVLVGALALFVTEAVPLGVAGLTIIAALGLTQVLTGAEAISAFSSPAVVLVGSLYVVSASLIRTGIVGAFEKLIVRLGQRSEARLLVVSTLGAAIASAFLNNTAVVVLMVPILLGAAQRLGIAPSRLLMPASFAAILGGTMTLIGTSTNVLVADIAEREGVSAIGFFEFLPMGAGFAGVGLLYLWTYGRAVLPTRPTVSSTFRTRRLEYVTELRVPATGPAVGLSLSELAKRAPGEVRVLQLIRGEEVMGGLEDRALVPRDLLVLRGSPAAILSLGDELRLEALPGGREGDRISTRGTTFAEIVVTPGASLQGRTLADIGLYRTYGVAAVAVQRLGAHLRHGITRIPLRVGDTILVQGAPEDVEKLRGRPGLLLLVGVEERIVVRRRAPVALAILGSFVAVAATGRIDTPLLAVAAAAACLWTGCLPLRRALQEVDWNVLGLLAGALTLGLALDRTGIAANVGEFVVDGTREFGPVAVLSSIYLLTAIATEFVSNAGSAAVMLPIALASAAALGVSPRPFVFAVAFAASASFSTPIGYQTNAFVLGPGGYRFRDFFRVGLPLQLILWIYASFAIPFFFPFELRV